jgi:hypothetical protein
MTEYAVYMDASGHPDDQSHVVVAGFLSTEQDWLSFEPKWKDVLKRHNLEYPFHMVDFESRHKKNRKRAIILADLINVINERTRTNFLVAVKMDDYRKVNELYAFEELIGAPYAIAARVAAMFINNWKRDNFKSGDHLLNFVEDGTKHKGDMEERFRADKLPVPIPVPKTVAAVQPADMLAWEGFHFAKYKDNRRSLIDLCKGKLSGGGFIGETKLLQMCKRHDITLRAKMAGMQILAAKGKRVRQRTIW